MLTRAGYQKHYGSKVTQITYTTGTKGLMPCIYMVLKTASTPYYSCVAGTPRIINGKLFSVLLD